MTFFTWFGKMENVEPSMVHIFIEAVVTASENTEIDATFDIAMAIRGK